ncbi:MAG TPA: EAL domain-containing protein, partial [Burkholderiaceae bacterium]|nr:EAL domain-containing protein [Burkholderiaceae bacterium]
LLVSVVFTLKFNQRFQWHEFLGSFGTIGVAYGGSALIAALLFLTVQQSGISVLLGALPVVAMLLTTVHYFMRQQEAVDAARRGRVEAAEREAEQTAKHLEALRESEQRFHSAFTHASIGMALVSFEGRILQGNTALSSLLGEVEASTLVNRPFAEFLLDDDEPLLRSELQRILAKESETFSIEVRCRHRSGSEIWVGLHCAFFSEPGSTAPCLILQVQDINARRQAESQLNQIAFHDSLTGLPNRRRFHTLLEQALQSANADGSRHFGLMFFDFDRFKLINDSMGHSAGDEFLVLVSRRLQQNVRPGDVVARLGGDEFAVLVNRLEHEHVATHLADRLQAVLREPMHIAGVSVTTSASIGITFSSMGYERPEDMLRDADIAMYRAKSAGKARYAVFDQNLHAQLTSRVRMEGDLRQTLAEGALHVAYQPVFNIHTNQLQGFEALARWTHPTLGEVSPGVFIPIAEESGLIIDLTDIILNRACMQLASWQERHPLLRDLKIQVNLSGNDLAHPDLAQRVERAVRDSGIQPARLTLELTENILMQRVDGAMHSLEALRRLGVGLAIDDFGTGYSSLAYLSSLPIDSLKIDRSFVKGMREGSKENEIVRAIVSLGGTLGKVVVAEGIETMSQFMLLRKLGCEQGQGYHLSRPMTTADVDKLLDYIVMENELGADRFASSGMLPFVRH